LIHSSIVAVKQSKFAKNVMTLLLGSSLAQAIPLALSPILTRIYSPEEFGVVTIYLSLVSIIAVLATGRYELAIVQPEKRADAISIVVLCCSITIVVSGILFLFVLFFNEQIAILLGEKQLGPWLFLLPVSIFLTGMHKSLNYWYVRNKQFKLVAASNVAQGMTTPTTQVIFNGMSGGLILGSLLGTAASGLVLLKQCLKKEKKSFATVTKVKMVEQAKRYSKLPKYSLAGSFADNTSQQLPVFFITRVFNSHATGLFSLTMRVINLPLTLISRSVSQVVLQKVADLNNTSPSQIKALIIKLFVLLLAINLPLIAVIWFFGGDLFSFVFGERWREAGELGRILVFALAIRFAVSPLSVVMTLDRNVRSGVVWQFMYLVTISLTLYFLSSYDLEVFMTGLVIHEVVLYVLYLVLIISSTNYKKGIEE